MKKILPLLPHSDTPCLGEKHKLTSNNPLETWAKQPEPRYDYNLTLPGLEKLMFHAAPHLAWAITVEWAVGARPGPSELYALQWSHVNFDKCRIRIPGTKTLSSDRIIPISPAFCDDLKKREKKAECAFICEYKGQRVKTMKTAFRGAQKRAKLPYHVRMYDIRHLFVSVLLDGGAAVGAVSRLIGHSAVATTQNWYYHLMPDEMERAISLKPELLIEAAQGIESPGEDTQGAVFCLKSAKNCQNDGNDNHTNIEIKLVKTAN